MNDSMKTGQDSRIKKTFFYGFILIYAAALLYLCNILNVWLDETYTLHTTSHNLSKVISQSYSFESQPPVYFILLSLWRKISADVFFARLFSIVSIALAAWIFYKIVRLISGNETSKWVLILFLLNPLVVWAGLEIRLYAFLLLLSTTLVYFYLKYYVNGKNKYLHLFLITSLIGLYTQYFFAFLIAALVFATFIFKGWKFCFKICLYLVPVVLLFLPNLLFMGDQLGMVQSRKEEYSFIQRAINVLHSPQNVILSMQTLPFNKAVRLGIMLLFAVAVLYACFKVYSNRVNVQKKPNYEIINFNLVTGLILTGILTIFIAYTAIDHQDRYFTIVLPFFILLFTLFEIHAPLTRTIMYSTLAIYFVLVFMYIYSKPAKQYDYKGVAKYIETKAKPGEPVLFYHSVISIPFSYYYKGSNTIIPLPHKVYYDTSFMNNVKDTFELKQSLQNINTTSKSYLLVSDLTEPRYKDNPDRKMVNGYFELHYNVTLDTLYYGKSKNSLRIRRFEKK